MPGTIDLMMCLDVNVWEVVPGSGMHYGGHQPGWYWDSPDDVEPRGPFYTKADAIADAPVTVGKADIELRRKLDRMGR